MVRGLCCRSRFSFGILGGSIAEKIYLTPAELIERWAGAVSHVKTLANWRNAGRGAEYVEIERKVLYPLKAVEEYKQANLHRPLAV